MNHAEAIVGTAAGLTAVWMGLTGKKFYALGPGQRPRPKTKTIPKWIGRPWFVVVGGFFLYSSMASLRGTWRWSDLKDAWWIALFLGGVWLLNLALATLESSEPKSGLQTLRIDRER
jgi:hypothetical protein